MLPAGRRPHVQLREHRHRHVDQRHRRRARQRRRRAGRRRRASRRRCGDVAESLTKQIARDGEGAETLIEVVRRPGPRPAPRPSGWPRRSSTRRSSRPPCTAPTPTGAGWRWRSASASDDTDIDQERVVIRFGDREVYPTPRRRRRAGRAVRRTSRGDEVRIHVSLGTGDADCTVWGCDLTAGYVRINADYTT